MCTLNITYNASNVLFIYKSNIIGIRLKANYGIFYTVCPQYRPGKYRNKKK